MISDQDEDDGLRDTGWAPGQRRQRDRQLLQPPQAARRLGELVEVALRRRRRRGIGQRDRVKELAE
jgi:hypothetical protein